MDLSSNSRALRFGMQAKERMRITGYTPLGRKLWSVEDDEIVKALYPSYADMKARLPERTLRALHARCEALGIAKKNTLVAGFRNCETEASIPNRFTGQITRRIPRVDLAGH